MGSNNPNTTPVLAPGSPWMPKPTYGDIVGEFRGRYTSQERGNVHEKNWKLLLLGTWTLKIATKQGFEILKILCAVQILSLIGKMSEIRLRKWWLLKTPTKPKFSMRDVAVDEIMAIFFAGIVPTTDTLSRGSSCYLSSTVICRGFWVSKSFPKSLMWNLISTWQPCTRSRGLPSHKWF